MLALKTAQRELQRDLVERGKQLAKRTRDLEELRVSMASQIAAAEQRFGDESALYKKRAAEADRFAKDLEASGFTEDLRSQTLIDQLKEKYVATVAHLEKKLKGEMEEVKAQSIKIRLAFLPNRLQCMFILFRN